MRNDRPASLPYVRCIALIVVLGARHGDGSGYRLGTGAASRRGAGPRGRRSRGVDGPGRGRASSRMRAETSGARAQAARAGRVRNSIRRPSGGRYATLVDVETAGASPGPAIVLGLPTGRGVQPNDRRYPIAVLGEGYSRSPHSIRPGFPASSHRGHRPDRTRRGRRARLVRGRRSARNTRGPRRAHRGEPGREGGRAAPVPGVDRRRRHLLPGRRPSGVRRRAAREPRPGSRGLDRGLDRRACPGLFRRRRPAPGARGPGRPRAPHGRRARRVPGGNGGGRALGRPLAARPDAERALLRALEPAGHTAPGPGAGRCCPALAPLRDLGVRRRGGAFARDGRRELVFGADGGGAIVLLAPPRPRGARARLRPATGDRRRRDRRRAGRHSPSAARAT